MLTILFALISYFTWGVGMIFEAMAAKKLESHSATFWSFILSLFFLTFYLPFVWGSLQNLTPSLFFLVVFIAFFFIFGTIVYYKAIKEGNPALVGTIAAAFPVIIVILSIIFLKEKLNFSQSISIIVIFIGLMLSTLNVKSVMETKNFVNRGTFYALITMISWGIALTFIKIPIAQIGWFLPNYIIFAFAPVILIYMKVRGIKLQRISLSRPFLALFVSIILIRIAEFSYNYALTTGQASIVAPISGAAPTLFVPLAFLVFKEKITKQQILGIITTLLGIVLLSMNSV